MKWVKELYLQLLDHPYEKGKIKKIDGISFSGDGFLWVSLPLWAVRKLGKGWFVPGATYRLYGRKGQPIRGLFINNFCVWYRTRAEQRRHLKGE